MSPKLKERVLELKNKKKSPQQIMCILMQEDFSGLCIAQVVSIELDVEVEFSGNGTFSISTRN